MGEVPCHVCKTITRVSALLIPGDPAASDEDDRMYPEDPAKLQYITSLNPEALAAWQVHAPWIRMIASATAGSTYLGNSCEHCQALQGDWYISEPDAPFFPTTKAGMDALRCIWVDVPLRADADASQSSWMDKLVDQIRT
jgi:hypothetical protein